MFGYTPQGVIFLKRDATLISLLRGAPVGNTGGSKCQVSWLPVLLDGNLASITQNFLSVKVHVGQWTVEERIHSQNIDVNLHFPIPLNQARIGALFSC